MMGNFLTTLGNTPDEDRAMFERPRAQRRAPADDNGANPRPDNRSGWLAGETPDVVSAVLPGRQRRTRRRSRCASGIPSTQLRFSPSARSRRGQPDGVRATRTRRRRMLRGSLGRAHRTLAAIWPPEREERPMIEIEARLDELQGARPAPPHAPGQRPAGPARPARRQAGAAAVLQQLPRARRPSRACARRRPTRRCAGASAPAPRGWSRAR